MRRYEKPPQVRVISQPNGGKPLPSTMVSSIQRRRYCFRDADGIFTHSTIREMLNSFTSEKIGAVCGNDYPINQDTAQTKLYTLQTHVGTGFVRRALAEINCLPIISGNCGAFRAKYYTAALSCGWASKANLILMALSAKTWN